MSKPVVAGSPSAQDSALASPPEAAAMASATATLPAEPPAAPTASDEARGAGRGGLAIAGAKIWFILVGFLQKTLLSRVIGMDGYGAFATVLAFSNIPNNLVTASSIQAVSRGVAAAGTAQEDQAQRQALKIHAAIAPCLAVLFFLLAPIAASFEHAPHILQPLRIFAAVLFIYGLYTPLVGALNGRRRFIAQAGLDVTFATLRTIGMLGAAYFVGRALGGPTAAAVGIAVAAAAILPIAWFIAGSGRSGPSPLSVRAHLQTLGGIVLGQLFLNLLMQADIWLLRRFAHEAGERAGIAGDALRTGADQLVGAYSAAQLFAFLPYQLLLSMTFILFPMLARAHSQHQSDAVASYVRTGVRLALVLAGLMVSCTSGLAPLLLRFAFPKQAADDGAAALRVLALGHGAFALFGIETTILVSLSREIASAILTGIAAVLVAIFCWWLVPSSPFDASIVLRTGSATAIALAAAALAGAVLVRRTAGSFASPMTLIRTLAAMGAAITVGSFLPWRGHVLVPVEAAIVVAVYLAVAIALRELTTADLAMVKKALGRKSSG